MLDSPFRIFSMTQIAFAIVSTFGIHSTPEQSVPIISKIPLDTPPQILLLKASISCSSLLLDSLPLFWVCCYFYHKFLIDFHVPSGLVVEPNSRGRAGSSCVQVLATNTAVFWIDIDTMRPGVWVEWSWLSSIRI